MDSSSSCIEIWHFNSMFVFSHDAAEMAAKFLSLDSSRNSKLMTESSILPFSSPEASIFACISFHSSKRNWASNWLIAFDSSSSSWESFLEIDWVTFNLVRAWKRGEKRSSNLVVYEANECWRSFGTIHKGRLQNFVHIWDWSTKYWAWIYYFPSVAWNWVKNLCFVHHCRQINTIFSPNFPQPMGSYKS